MAAPSHKELISAVLAESDKYGGTGLPLTALLKFLYLADVYTAEATNGAARCSTWSWRFHHYGPYSTGTLETLTELEKGGFVLREERATGGDRDFSLLKWNSAAKASALEQLEIPLYARMRIAQDIKRFRFDLPGLLDHVYFDTTPMKRAVPGQLLSFESCRRLGVRDLKPILIATPPSVSKRAKELLAVMEKRFQQSKDPNTAPSSILDAEYLGTLDVEQHRSDGTASCELNAELTFPKEE